MRAVVTVASVMVGTGVSSEWRGMSLSRMRGPAETKLRIHFQVHSTSPEALKSVLDQWVEAEVILGYTVNSHGMAPVVVCEPPLAVIDEMCRKRSTDHRYINKLRAVLASSLSLG